MEKRAVGPVGGVDYPQTYQDLLAWFPDDRACLEYLARVPWPEGFVCPVCDARDYWGTASGLWMCAGRERKTSVTAGTIFHRTRTPLSTWFAAIWFITSQRNGISAQGLQRVLGLGSYETAWAWMHKLRRAMVRPDRDLLSGIVEVDGTYVGGVSAGKPGGFSDKVPVLVAAEKINGGRRLGRIRLQVARRHNSLELVEFAQHVVQPGSTIRTDGARMMRRLDNLGYTHEYLNGTLTDDKDSVMPGVHLSVGLLRRWLVGTLHYGIADKHLPYYLDEYTFRFNRRTSKSRGMLFYRLIEQAVRTEPHPLNILLHPKPN